MTSNVCAVCKVDNALLSVRCGESGVNKVCSDCLHKAVGEGIRFHLEDIIVLGTDKTSEHTIKGD